MVLSALLLACLTVLCVRGARARPWLLAGWLWFCVMVLAVIGLVQIGWQARADRYTHLPSIGLFILVAWGGAELGSRLPALRPGWALLLAQGNLAAGVTHYTTARRLRPDDVATAADLAAALVRQPESLAALPYLQAALDLLPSADLRAQLASAWAAQGKFQFAVLTCRAALTLQPESPGILNNLAWVLASSPRAEVRDGAEAVRFARQACELTQFQRAVMVGTLATAYAEAGQFDEAVSTAQKACALAAASGDQALVARNEELQQMYRAGRPYREAAPPAPDTGIPSQPRLIFISSAADFGYRLGTVITLRDYD